MPRPRKNPNDPKWLKADQEAAEQPTETQEQPQETASPTEPEKAHETTTAKIENHPANDVYTDLFALHAALAELDFIKESEGNTGARSYKYLDLPSLDRLVKPVLHKHRFIWYSKPTVNADGMPVLRYILRHISGWTDEGDMPMPATANTKPQDMGGIITYFRRYALTAHLGIVADEDDDASKAQREMVNQEKTDKEQIRPDKETKIYTMLKRLNITVEDYEVNLSNHYGKPTTVKDLTNAEADKIIAQMTAEITRTMASAEPDEA